jgi:hypothetical protein
VNDVNNVHLVCRNLHQIGNLFVYPKLSFKRGSPKDLESLVRSSRIFGKLEFTSGSNDNLRSHGRFRILEEYLGFTGPHIKKLKISDLKVDSLVFQKLLTMFPNLEALSLMISIVGASKLHLKSRKIERVKMTGCRGLDGLLGSLEKSRIKELKLTNYSETNPEAIKNFLKSQEKNLKKLTTELDFDLLWDLKDLRLEYLDFGYSGSHQVSLEFLRQQVDLRFLRLSRVDYSDQTCNVIWGLKKLESLELEGRSGRRSCLRNLHRLGKLRRLKVDEDVSRNILDHMKFGVFENLEELDAAFKGATLESIQEMKRITPNLKKLLIHETYSDTINALLGTLENLESLKIDVEKWEVDDQTVHPKIKHLDVACDSKFKPNTKFLKAFPNLEHLKINNCTFAIKKPSFITLLSGLKRLKTLYLRICYRNKIDPDLALRGFQEHGDHLEGARVVFGFRNLRIGRDFAIEKKPGGEFCIERADCPLHPAWLRDFF